MNEMGFLKKYLRIKKESKEEEINLMKAIKYNQTIKFLREERNL